MRKNLHLAIAFIFLLTGTSIAQTKKGFNFQGYARNAEGAALTSQSVNVKFTIYPSGQPGSPDFEETQVTTTDAFGVFQLTVGVISTTPFKNLRFSEKDYWLKVEIKTSTSDFVEIANTELLAVPYARSADNGVPAGTILPFAGPKSKIPFGYLACDGATYNTSDYPVLFNVIGASWGGSGSQFKVPDLRGMFLRGVSEGSNVDEDKASRAAIATGGNSGNDVGSVQTEGTKSHNHSGTTSTDGNHTHDWKHGTEGDDSGSGGSNNEFTLAGGTTTDVMTTNGDHSHTFTTSSSGGNETRPDNAYVYFIIKH
jgi:microcystin-dependent protein